MNLFGGPGDKKKDKPRPDFSNVQSGSSSTAPRPAEPAPTTPATYVVQKGDSLSKIAKRVYGNASDWRKIFEANRDSIENPDLIYPGQTLNIPPA